MAKASFVAAAQEAVPEKDGRPGKARASSRRRRRVDAFAARPPQPRRGLVTDFGGVLTTNIFDTFAAFCLQEGLAPETLRDVFRQEHEARALVNGLETGELATTDFETGFGALLGVAADGLLDRLFVTLAIDPVMVEAVVAARRQGIRTCLLSNSWGTGIYERAAGLLDRFDAVVISGEVGLRKPDPRIYELALERLGLPAEACVFVDDLPSNLEPARELGMAVVRHSSAEETLTQLERLLGVGLRAAIDA